MRWVFRICIPRCICIYVRVLNFELQCVLAESNCCDLIYLYLYLYSSLYLYLSLCFELWVAMCISWKQLLWCEFYESTRGTSFQQGSQQAKVKCDNNIRKFSEKYSAKYLFFKREITKHFALSWKPCLSLRSGQIPDREPPCNVNISDSLFFHPFPCTCTIPFMSKYWICLPSLNHYTSGGDLGYQCVSVAAQRLSWGVVKAVDAAWW